jgi:hypothetical protein
MSQNEEFIKIINDFTKDLQTSYPEFSEKFSVIDYDDYFAHCKNIYPENFFNILYENDELFDTEECKYLLPDVDFKIIMNDEKLSDNSKKTIWKYLQLVLFIVCNDVKTQDEFGEANHLFEAIKEDDLHEKIQSTMKEMKEIFMNMEDASGDGINNIFDEALKDISGVEDMFNNMDKDSSGNNIPFENMMDADKLKDHLSGIMDGKIGTLAKEIAEEASKELGIDESNMDEAKQQDFLKNMFKNPSKILSIVKNIGNKLEEKFKNGELKESELLEEAKEIMEKMKDMPGLKNMMSSMGMGAGGKFDFKGMAGKMQQSMRQAKMKEKMREKLNKKREEAEKVSQDLGMIKEVSEDTFVWNDSNSNPNTPLMKSSSKPHANKNKKKNKGKKKRN